MLPFKDGRRLILELVRLLCQRSHVFGVLSSAAWGVCHALGKAELCRTPLASPVYFQIRLPTLLLHPFISAGCFPGIMAEDGGLMLNITGTNGSGQRKFQKPPKPKDNWRHKLAKRKLHESEAGPQTKRQRKPLPSHGKRTSNETNSPPKGEGATDASAKKTPESSHEGRSLIKTSSLFKNNPEIPEIHKSTVKQLEEKVFTSDSFQALDLHPHLVATLSSVLKINSMTRVQKVTIPALLAGRDAMVRSQTGSGKTLSYGVPLVQSLQGLSPKIQRSDGPFALILVPTRELALQSFDTIQKLLKPFMWIVPGVLMGGEKKKSEKARIRKGINILISTPGRLVDHIKTTKNIHFGRVQWLILDEADRILDLGFEKDITAILNALNAECDVRQNVLLSATLSEGVVRLADISLQNPVSVSVTEEAQGAPPLETRDGVPGAVSGPDSYAIPENLQQHVAVVPSKLRLVLLAAFVLGKCMFEKKQKLIVFFPSCEMVEFHHTLFTKVLNTGPQLEGPKPSDETPPQLKFLRLHGNMEQKERTEVFLEFSQCRDGILLCTDVAARGLDLPQVTWIVQYSAPSSPAEYIHRIGRTARIGLRGSSLLLLTPSEAGYVHSLAAHKISVSELKMEDILGSLMNEDRFKVKRSVGKKSSGSAEQEVRERATVLQTKFENYVHSSEERLQQAKAALQSFIRSYATYHKSLKHIFHVRTLHLGHVAKSFGLRDAPQNLIRPPARGQEKKRRPGHGRPDLPKKQTNKQRLADLMLSEFSSGIVPEVPKKAKGV
ncbi:ATP-dependent DNA helicase DDX31 [Ambystoma mexicanum]|uniref:ATP-dependent DNA helicase DDX31 n=1 Tax=Ambystoma mexicanum TaxID=8296 RepID=UPI0037E927F2